MIKFYDVRIRGVLLTYAQQKRAEMSTNSVYAGLMSRARLRSESRNQVGWLLMVLFRVQSKQTVVVATK